MQHTDRITEALAHDLRNEYGVAFRYLILSEELKRRDKQEAADILQSLAADSVSHSVIVKDMLKSLKYPYYDSVTSFSTDFSNLESVLRGSYLIERKMHMDYKELAGELEENHPFKETLSVLSLWERHHMNSVAEAIKSIGEIGKEPATHTISSMLINSKANELKEAENMPADDAYMPMGAAFLTEQKEAEEILSRFLSIENPEGIGEEEKEKLKTAELATLGQKAEELVDANALDIIWSKKDYAGYCLKCRSTVNMDEQERIVLANMKTAIRGKCEHCKASVFTTA